MSSHNVKEAILNAKPRAEPITFFGQNIELRQATTREIMARRTEAGGDSAKSMALMIIQLSWDPVTGTKIFEDTDIESIMELPFGEDMSNISTAIGKLINIDVKDALKNSAPTGSNKES